MIKKVYNSSEIFVDIEWILIVLKGVCIMTKKYINCVSLGAFCGPASSLGN